jgi:hypothetical protein
MNPLFEDILWLSSIGALISIGILGWLGVRLYQQDNPKGHSEAKNLKNVLSQLPLAQLSLPLWVRIIFYLPLGLLGLWMLNK